VLGEPQADCLLDLERVRADEDRGRDERISGARADDQDGRLETGPLRPAFGERTLRILLPVYRIPSLIGHYAGQSRPTPLPSLPTYEAQPYPRAAPTLLQRGTEPSSLDFSTGISLGSALDAGAGIAFS
jgi:hypothetical protein